MWISRENIYKVKFSMVCICIYTVGICAVTYMWCSSHLCSPYLQCANLLNAVREQRADARECNPSIEKIISVTVEPRTISLYIIYPKPAGWQMGTWPLICLRCRSCRSLDVCGTLLLCTALWLIQLWWNIGLSVVHLYLLIAYIRLFLKLSALIIQ